MSIFLSGKIKTGPSRYKQLKDLTGIDPVSKPAKKKRLDPYCGFCKNNGGCQVAVRITNVTTSCKIASIFAGEDPEVYKSHVLKYDGKVTCPGLYIVEFSPIIFKGNYIIEWLFSAL